MFSTPDHNFVLLLNGGPDDGATLDRAEKTLMRPADGRSITYRQRQPRVEQRRRWAMQALWS